MVAVNDKSSCSGCGLCSVVCPQNCISMTEDEYGFVFPAADSRKCISCGKCDIVCPFKDNVEKGCFHQKAYAAYSTDKEMRFNGSSGGIFGTFATNIIDGGGVVYGASFDDDLQLKMKRVADLVDLPRLYKSKYLQSDCRDAYFSIEKDLIEGKKVLVCSTPCQIAAIKRYLKKDYTNLLTIDFFCHGTPSQSFFNKCKEYVERKQGIKILDYQFRTKGRATNYYYTLRYTKKGKERTVTDLYIKDPFFLSFQKYITLRDSCYSCKFAGENRSSDITIGDFHTINRYVKGIDRFKGVSTVILNSEKGEKLFLGCGLQLNVTPVNLEKLIENKDCFAGPVQKPVMREPFLHDLVTKDFDQMVQEYMNPKKEWKKALYYKLPLMMRNVLKHIIFGESV